jgi:site-specific recombinase XerD
VRSRNARLAALRSFLKYAAHHDLTALAVIEQALSVPMKRFEKPMLGFLTREEMRAILEAPDVTTWTGRHDRALFNVMYNTGARVSEAISVCVYMTSSPSTGRRPFISWEKDATAKRATLETHHSATAGLDKAIE